MVERLAARGIAVVWDTDDDVLGTPKFSPTYKEIGGRRKLKRRWELAVRIAKAAHLVTTPSRVLADTHRDAGVEHVEVIENHVGPPARSAPRACRDAVVVGYVAGLEHMQDLEGATGTLRSSGSSMTASSGPSCRPSRRDGREDRRSHPRPASGRRRFVARSRVRENALRREP